ncbi:uncharacterized protein LOC118434067 [Folsomia candida]|uniref:uncharacterized protein LOC118434067 n=1 Tax=Folsomia candida TaxID=158441 RepID=UPI0016051967|nr:uncharacterized protein LOC118434067 [Folsomia candida]
MCRQIIFILFLIFGGTGSDANGMVHSGIAKILRNIESLMAQKLSEGVEVDNSFIPIYSDHDSHPSSRGCPSPTNKQAWVKFGTPPRCYLTGYQGPCPLHMKLFYNINSPEFGYCQCDCFPSNVTSRDEYYCMRNVTDSNYGTELRAYGFYADTKLCYPLFSQGPCKSDEWFVMDSSEKISTCEKRPCRPPRDSNELMFFSNGTKSCQKLHAGCRPESPDDSANYKFTFVRGTWIPQCIMYLGGGGGFVGSVGELDCQEGFTFSKLLQKCVPPFKKLRGNVG